MDQLVEQNTEVFTFEEDETEEEKELSVKAADVKRAVKNAEKDGTSKEDVAILNEWLALSDKKDTLSRTLKEKRSALTEKVVKKYASLSEEEIKALVVERKWLASIVDGCEALMQNITHRIGRDVTALVERYEDTLADLSADVSRYEDEVNGYLREMGFTI